jgi:hypothetical protein
MWMIFFFLRMVGWGVVSVNNKCCFVGHYVTTCNDVCTSMLCLLWLQIYLCVFLVFPMVFWISWQLHDERMSKTDEGTKHFHFLGRIDRLYAKYLTAIWDDIALLERLTSHFWKDWHRTFENIFLLDLKWSKMSASCSAHIHPHGAGGIHGKV